MNDASRRLLDCLKKQEAAAKVNTLNTIAANQWEEIVAAAGRHGVVPVLYHTLKPFFAGLDIPALVREKMQRIYFLSAARNMRLYRELFIVLAALKDRGISVILLKGAHLADTVYGNIALRPMVDVDFLARPGDLRMIHDVLLDLGYSSADGELSCQLHLAPYSKQNSLTIEVHFHITRPPVSLRCDLDAMWRRARTYSSQDIEVMALCPEDLVLHLCTHTALDHGFDNGLIPYMDLWKITDFYGDQLDWEQVWSRACQWGMERSVFVMLALTERLLGLPVPGPIREKMDLDADVRQAVDEAETMIFETGAEPGETVSPIVARLFGPQGWREKLGYFRRRAFPPGENMSVAFQEPGSRNHGRLFRLYLTRLATLMTLHGQTIWAGLRRDPAALRMLEMENRKNRLRDWLTGAGHAD